MSIKLVVLPSLADMAVFRADMAYFAANLADPAD